jgi:ADP-ribosyl-[dinitrogen reductase] hydrolase
MQNAEIHMEIQNTKSDKFRGLMIGTAVGDSLGLPSEGFGPKTIAALGWIHWKQRLIFGKGMVSDDTEHTLFVAQALLCHNSNSEEFKKSLAWKLRWWLLSVPASIGLGTLKAIMKLWFFIPLDRSGVISAGNGPAMRSAIIGAYFFNDKIKINEFVHYATELTHRDPRALVGAIAVSYAAAFGMASAINKKPDIESFLNILRSISLSDKEWTKLVEAIGNGLKQGLSVSDFACSINLHKGVSGYIYHTVPVAIYAWLRYYGDFKTSLTETLNCGGDTDTVGAITGALAGVTTGENGIPTEWVKNIWEWPRSVSVLRKVADALAGQNNSPTKPIRYFWPGLIFRNILFITIVLVHLFLRLIPAKIRGYIRI